MAKKKFFTLHMAATREFVIGAVKHYGAKDVLSGWTGSDEEAVEALLNGPRFLIVGGSCGNVDEDGKCAGHE